MIEERRAAIEREIKNLKYYRKVLRKLYYKLDGVIPEVVLADIVSDIYLLEGRIVKLRTEKLLIDKAHEEAFCEAADKTLQEYADIAAGRDLESTAKRFEEAREEHGTPLWKGSPVGGIFIDGDNVAHVHGTVVAPKMVIEEAPRRTGRTFRSWLCNYFK